MQHLGISFYLLFWAFVYFTSGFWGLFIFTSAVVLAGGIVSVASTGTTKQQSDRICFFFSCPCLIGAIA